MLIKGATRLIPFSGSARVSGKRGRKGNLQEAQAVIAEPGEHLTHPPRFFNRKSDWMNARVPEGEHLREHSELEVPRTLLAHLIGTHLIVGGYTGRDDIELGCCRCRDSIAATS
jgi:hypothetical protein